MIDPSGETDIGECTSIKFQMYYLATLFTAASVSLSVKLRIASTGALIKESIFGPLTANNIWQSTEWEMSGLSLTQAQCDDLGAEIRHTDNMRGFLQSYLNVDQVSPTLVYTVPVIPETRVISGRSPVIATVRGDSYVKEVVTGMSRIQKASGSSPIIKTISGRSRIEGEVN